MKHPWGLLKYEWITMQYCTPGFLFLEAISMQTAPLWPCASHRLVAPPSQHPQWAHIRRSHCLFPSSSLNPAMTCIVPRQPIGSPRRYWTRIRKTSRITTLSLSQALLLVSLQWQAPSSHHQDLSWHWRKQTSANSGIALSSQPRGQPWAHRLRAEEPSRIGTRLSSQSRGHPSALLLQIEAPIQPGKGKPPRVDELMPLRPKLLHTQFGANSVV